MRVQPSTPSPRSKFPPVLASLSYMKLEGDSYSLQVVQKVGRHVMLHRSWQFELDPCGQLPPSVAKELWDLVQAPLDALAMGTQLGFF